MKSFKKNIFIGGLLFVICLCVSFCVFGLAKTQKGYAENPKGNLTINGQADVSYEGYNVFTGTIQADTSSASFNEVATYIEWSSDEMKDVTLSFIRNNGYNNESDSAPDALYYIKTQIENDGVSTVNVADYFSYKFAKELVENKKINITQSINSGEKANLDQGYWLFVSPASLDISKASTCPIWTSVSDADKTIDEKAAASSIPSLSKVMLLDGEEVSVLDARVGDVLDYKIRGTLPSNILEFPSYRYIVTDTMSGNLKPVFNEEGQLEYTLTDLDGNVYSPDIINYNSSDNQIEFGFYDLTKIDGVNGDTVFEFSYKAVIVSGAQSGPIDNKAVLTYTNNPVTGAMATTVSTEKNTPNVYTYKLNIHVVDANSEKGTYPGFGLEGAQFGVKVGEEQFIQADGSIGPTTYLFTSDANGLITIPGLSHGNYTFVQEYVTDGYVSQDFDVDITINPEYDEHSLTKLNSELSGGYKPPLIGTKWQKSQILDIDIDQCTIDARICNLHASNVMPVTGLAGYAIIGAIALCVLIACSIGIYKIRAKGKKASK